MQQSTLNLNRTVSGTLRLPGRPSVSPASASSVTDRDPKQVCRFTACLRALGWISLLSLLLASVPVAWATGDSAAADLAGSPGEFNGVLGCQPMLLQALILPGASPSLVAQVLDRRYRRSSTRQGVRHVPRPADCQSAPPRSGTKSQTKPKSSPKNWKSRFQPEGQWLASDSHPIRTVEDTNAGMA